ANSWKILQVNSKVVVSLQRKIVKNARDQGDKVVEVVKRSIQSVVARSRVELKSYLVQSPQTITESVSHRVKHLIPHIVVWKLQPHREPIPVPTALQPHVWV